MKFGDYSKVNDNGVIPENTIVKIEISLFLRLFQLKKIAIIIQQ